VIGGTLKAGSLVALSPSSAFTVDGNGTLDLGGFSNTIGSLNGGGLVTNTGPLSPAILTVGADGSGATFSGILADGASSIGLTKIGGGLMLLNGSSTYSGPTLVSVGILQACSNTAFSPSSAFTVNSVLDLNGFSNTIGSLAGTGTVTNADGGPTTLTAGVDNSSTTFSGHLDDGTSALAFVKAGAGTMILASPGTYSGGTSIFPGTLVAAASNALGTGPVQLIAGTLIIQEGVTLPESNKLRGRRHLK
jgi:autotransporter-associated beta strand protein